MSGKPQFCRNEECKDSVFKRPRDPKPLRFLQEYGVAWTFICDTCRGLSVRTKDQVGGSWGVGQRSDGTGTTTGKGPSRYRAGIG